jgi:hypothetical protein
MSYSQKEFERNRSKEHEDGTYMDDGAVEVTCLYCGNKRPGLDTGECCEKRRKEIENIINENAKFAIDSGLYDKEISKGTEHACVMAPTHNLRFYVKDGRAILQQCYSCLNCSNYSWDAITTVYEDKEEDRKRESDASAEEDLEHSERGKLAKQMYKDSDFKDKVGLKLFSDIFLMGYLSPMVGNDVRSEVPSYPRVVCEEPDDMGTLTTTED